MFDYATIKAIKRHAVEGKWPLKVPKALESHYALPIAAQRAMPRWSALKLLRRLPIAQSVHLPFYYSGHMFQSGTRSWEYPWVLNQLRGKPFGKVLDVGCGSSEFIFQYLELGHTVLGLDRVRSPEFPESELTAEFVSRWKGTVEFIDAFGNDIPLPDESIDYIVCLSVLEHIVSRSGPARHRAVLSELRRVLKPGGLLIMTCDTFTNPKVAYGGLPGWNEQGWDYADDINYLRLRPLDPNARIASRAEIDADEDTFFIPIDMYFAQGYGTGFEHFGDYHRMTSIGYVLVK